MLLKGLDRMWKLSISGSINSKLRSISEDVVFEEIFDDWYEDKFEKVDGKIQYIKIRTDERLNVDAELLEDLKNVFQERFNRRVNKVKVKNVERVNRQKKEPATDKQIKYARKLYKKVYKEEKSFDDREYTKYEMIEPIEKTYTISSGEEHDFKVIEFNKYKK